MTNSVHSCFLTARLKHFPIKMLRISENCPHMEVSVQLWTPTGLNHRAPTLLGISGRTSDSAAGVQEMLSPTSHSPLAFCEECQNQRPFQRLL